MEKIRKSSIICGILTIGTVASACLYAYPRLTEKAEQVKEKQGVITVWNVDSFEGGKGSRTSFLKSVAKRFEKESDKFVMVSSYTAEGVKDAFAQGRYPNILSFGVGIPVDKTICYAYDESEFPFAEPFFYQDGTYALPWCAGCYAFYGMTDDFSQINAENTVVSDGGNNLSSFAFSCTGNTTTPKTEKSVDAYVEFLNGKYKYLFGTQRDFCRFSSRGTAVYSKRADGYSDLFQYVCVFQKDENDKKACEEFIKTLFSKSVQETLSSIGMFSAVYTVNGEENSLYPTGYVLPKRTVDPFCDAETLRKMHSKSVGQWKDGEKEFDKFLKVL